MQLKTETNTYLDLKDNYGKVINEQIIIYAQSGYSKGLAMEGILESFHKAGYIVLCIADPKQGECELAYQMFEPIEKYHLDHLRKIGKRPSAKKVKLYHPFCFGIPTNRNLPDINFFTFPLKDLGRKEWSLLVETEYDTETMGALIRASENITNEDGIYGFLQYVQKSVKGKGSGKTRKADPSNFFLETGSGTMKSVSEVSRYLQPFRQNYFLSKKSCPLNIDWKSILTDQEHYHVFLNSYLSKDEKILDFVVLALLNGILNNKHLLKKPVVIALPEIRKQVPFKPDGHKRQLAIGFKDSLALMRSSGRGMSSVSDSQSFSGVDKDVRDSATTTFFGEMGADAENVSKTFNYKREIRSQLTSMDAMNSFLKVKNEEDGGITLFFSSSRHGEPSYNFEETYRKECPEKMKNYKDIVEMMKKDLKDDENKIRDKIKKQEKRDKEERERIAKEKAENSSEVKVDKDKDKKIQELMSQSKLEKMKRCWEFRRDNPDVSLRKSALAIGFPSSSGNKTFKKYFEEYQEILDKEKEKEDNVDFEDKVLNETKVPEEKPLLGEEFELPEE